MTYNFAKLYWVFHLLKGTVGANSRDSPFLEGCKYPYFYSWKLANETLHNLEFSGTQVSGIKTVTVVNQTCANSEKKCYLRLYVQSLYLPEIKCTVPLFTWDYMYSPFIYLRLHVQSLYLPDITCTVALFT